VFICYFQDKVANVWCSLSVIIKWKQVLSRDQILLMWYDISFKSCHVFFIPLPTKKVKQYTT